MNNVLFRHCTERVIEAVNIGSMELVNLRQNELTPEFILLGLLEQDNSEAMRLIGELGHPAAADEEIDRRPHPGSPAQQAQAPP